GAICNYGQLTLKNCTLSGNTAAGNNGMADQGGAIFNDAFLSLTNCTLAANAAGTVIGSNSGSGGGVFSVGGVSEQTLKATMTNCTVSGNTATKGGGGLYNYDGLWATYSSGNAPSRSANDFTFELANTIVAGNMAPGTALSPDAFGQFVSLGHNLIG